MPDVTFDGANLHVNIPDIGSFDVQRKLLQCMERMDCFIR